MNNWFVTQNLTIIDLSKFYAFWKERRPGETLVFCKNEMDTLPIACFANDSQADDYLRQIYSLIIENNK